MRAGTITIEPAEVHIIIHPIKTQSRIELPLGRPARACNRARVMIAPMHPPHYCRSPPQNYTLPPTRMESEGGGGGEALESKVAVTVILVFARIVQEFVPLQPPPLHPVKVELALATAVRVTAVPLG